LGKEQTAGLGVFSMVVAALWRRRYSASSARNADWARKQREKE